MRIAQMLPKVLLLGLLAGCASSPKHAVNVSPELRAHPVRRVYIFDPAFPNKVKRRLPDDFAEMAPENQPASAAIILSELATALMAGKAGQALPKPLTALATLGASLTVDSTYFPPAGAREWAAGIAADLAKVRVPLGVEPQPVPVEAALIVGVPVYGTENSQFTVQILWLKPTRLGSPKWEHVCDLQAILVDPRTGGILLDIRHETRLTSGSNDPATLLNATRETARAIADAFPAPAATEGGEKPE
jgi:hypothetical protein